MRFGKESGESSDRYDELMSRRATLEAEVQRRIDDHMRANQQLLPLSGSSRSFGGSCDGYRLGVDGALHTRISLRDVRGVETAVSLRSDPEGSIMVFEPSGQNDEPPGRPIDSFDETERCLGAVTDLVREHLPAQAGDEFLGMLRPALRLEHARNGEPVVAQLGGLPTLPINSWPVWEGHGPLSHILSFDCAPVVELLPELGLPVTGRLSFFYFDGQIDNFESSVGFWDPSTRPGAKVLHLHPELSTRSDICDAATPAPPGLTPYPTVPLAAVRTLTWPSYEDPTAAVLWEKHGLMGPRDGVPADPVGALYDALWELPEGGGEVHQIGGYPSPQQGPVEFEVEQLRQGVAGEPTSQVDATLGEAAAQWRLLLQVASDGVAGMMWGDVGQLFYLAQDVGAPEGALFTWQCG